MSELNKNKDILVWFVFLKAYKPHVGFYRFDIKQKRWQYNFLSLSLSFV